MGGSLRVSLQLRVGGGLLRMLIGRDSMWVDNHWVDDRSRFQLQGATPQEVKPTALSLSHIYTLSYFRCVG